MRHRSLAGLAAVALAFGMAACGAPAAPPAAIATPAAPAPATSAPPAAPAATNVADLVGARASSGESEMQSRGFTTARQRGLTAYWWNAAVRNCVQTVTADGRYRTVMPVAAANCGQ